MIIQYDLLYVMNSALRVIHEIYVADKLEPRKLCFKESLQKKKQFFQLNTFKTQGSNRLVDTKIYNTNKALMRFCEGNTL